MAYQMVEYAVYTQIQQVAVVGEDSQVSLENLRIEIPGTGGKKIRNSNHGRQREIYV